MTVALFAGVANGQSTADLWLQVPGGGNTLSLTVSETGIIQLWMDYTNPTAEWHSMVGMDALLIQAPAESNIEVTGFAGPGATADEYGPWSVDFYTYSRGQLDEAPFDGTPDYTGVNNIEYYMYIGTSDPPYTQTSGLEPDAGAMLLDELIIHGVYNNEDISGTWGWGDRVFFAGGDFAPSWFEASAYGAWPGTITAETSFAMGTGSAKANPIFVQVPEPSTLALLAFGGLAAIRRRR
jgi:hypothetical protein